jgi:hypothetical protein
VGVISPISDYPHHLLLLAPGDVLQSHIAGTLPGRGVFTAWEQAGLFDEVAVIEDGAAQWPGEIDMCPDALYLRMTGKEPEDLFPALLSRTKACGGPV